jgi:hypothetical protein
MKYYKIIKNTSLVGLTTENDFIKFQPKTKILAFCSFEKGHYIKGFDEIFYRDIWMTAPITDEISYQEATITEIPEEEYFLLLDTVRTENEIIDFGETGPVYIDRFYSNETIPSEPEIELVPEPTVEYVRSVKLLEMSYNCNKTITNGFDITLSDGNSYHFSLTTQDQLNLITLATMVESGETQIPYHADGEPCKFYSTLDMKAIIDKATEFKTYHTSYYNSLKTYINNMETMEEISTVTYGIEIPEEYQSEVLKTLNK